jgi:hypothetical protein
MVTAVGDNSSDTSEESFTVIRRKDLDRLLDGGKRRTLLLRRRWRKKMSRSFSRLREGKKGRRGKAFEFLK